jgi:DNA-binding response OmpR family regulator
MAKVLIVEDDEGVAQLIQFALDPQLFAIDHYGNVADALHALKANEYDIVILDWVLPDGTGIELCRQYRLLGGHKPILMLTARDSSREKVTGLTAGADDYVVKPFDPDELVARVQALLRRPPTMSDAVLQVAGIDLDTASFTATVEGKSIQLLPKEFAILKLLMDNPNKYFSAEGILARVWRSEAAASTDSVRTHLKTLRKKLNEASGSSIIENSRGLGYIIKTKN